MASRKPKPLLGKNAKNQLSRELLKFLQTQLRPFLNTPLKKALAAAFFAVLGTLGYLGQGDSSNSSTSTTTVTRPKGPFELQGLVTHVADGDTINLKVNGQRERIRLANIDAPESDGRSDRPGQPYAEESKQAMAAMVLNKNLTVQCYEQDHYGRNVCNVILPDGRIANNELVRQGLAWAYTGSNRRYLRDESVEQIQKQAEKARIGLWQDKKPVAPWDWRVQCWQKKQCG